MQSKTVEKSKNCSDLFTVHHRIFLQMLLIGATCCFGKKSRGRLKIRITVVLNKTINFSSDKDRFHNLFNALLSPVESRFFFTI